MSELTRQDKLWRDVLELVRKHKKATPEEIGAAFARVIHAMGFWEGHAHADLYTAEPKAAKVGPASKDRSRAPRTEISHGES